MNCSVARMSQPSGEDDQCQCVTGLSGLDQSLCDVSGVVYSFKCLFCSSEYVGETGRCVRDRVKEHHFQARHRKPFTPGGAHMATHQDITLKTNDVESVATGSHLMIGSRAVSARTEQSYWVTVENRKVRAAFNIMCW